MKTSIILSQFHSHDVSEEMLKQAIEHHINIFENEEGGLKIITHDFEKTVGTTACVDTSKMKSPEVYFACRGDRPYPSRMIKGIKPQPCSCITIIIKNYEWKRDNNNTYLYIHIATSYVGICTPREYTELQYKRSIGEIDFTEEDEVYSQSYWDSHALIP